MLTHEDLQDVRAQWEEWTAGMGFDLDVVIVGEHGPATMDPDLPLAAIIPATVHVRLQIRRGDLVVFDERIDYDSEQLRASVAVLARTIGG